MLEKHTGTHEFTIFVQPELEQKNIEAGWKPVANFELARTIVWLQALRATRIDFQFPVELSDAKMLSVWIMDKEAENEVEFDIDYLETVENFNETGLAEFLGYCKELWGKSEFHQFITQLFRRILKLDDHHAMPVMDTAEALHAYNIAWWLTWVCVSIAVNKVE